LNVMSASVYKCLGQKRIGLHLMTDDVLACRKRGGDGESVNRVRGIQTGRSGPGTVGGLAGLVDLEPHRPKNDNDKLWRF
jgi:hypothetical protein